jgi:hypothetical protein
MPRGMLPSVRSLIDYLLIHRRRRIEACGQTAEDERGRQETDGWSAAEEMGCD